MKKSNLMKYILIAVLSTTLCVGVLGYFTTGYTSSELTVNPEGAVTGLDSVQQFEGWQLHYKGESAADGYDAIRAIYTYDEELLKSYEDKGYKVEVGAVFGVGMDNTNGCRYNTADKLAVEEKGGALVSVTDRADVYLFYSSDDKVETLGWFDSWAYGDDVSKVGRAEYNFEDGADPNGTTYVVSSFVRLTSQSGRVTVRYLPGCEVLCVDPLVFGD